MFDHYSDSLGDPQDGRWIESLLDYAGIGLLPIEQQLLRNDYSTTYIEEGRSAANARLRETVQSQDRLIERLITHGFDIGQTAIDVAKRFNACYRLDQVERTCDRLGVPVPTSRTEEGLFLRAQNAAYWRQHIAKECIRYHEGQRRRNGLVKHGIAKYVSNRALTLMQEQNRELREFLETRCIAESDHGEVCTGAELVDKSTTTPYKRGIELMIRARGFQEYAELLNHPWTFITITTPSQFHAFYKDTGKPVKSFNGMRPDEIHQHYFKPNWERCRSKLNRLGVRFYGFRVCEPHHDGTPHWHLLIWCESETHLELLKQAIVEAFAPDAPDDERRIKFEDHDPEKGGAADYIGKYVGKNISGEAIDESEKSDVARAQAWARVWGMHQFDQLGGPPVGVYRDLRKVRDRKVVPQSMLAAWEAANASDWCGFIQAMGGPFLGKDYPIKNVRGLKRGINGEVSPSKNGYGEPLVTDEYDIRPVIGLVCEDDFLKTYDRFWTLKIGVAEDVDGGSSATTEGCGAWTCGNNCTLEFGAVTRSLTVDFR